MLFFSKMSSLRPLHQKTRISFSIRGHFAEIFTPFVEQFKNVKFFPLFLLDNARGKEENKFKPLLESIT